MFNRFRGEGGRRALVDTLKRNRIVEGNQDLAAAIADVGILRQLAPGDALIREGEGDNSVFLVLVGALAVHVKGSKVGERVPGEIVGETSAIDPTQRRSATLIASEDSVVLELAGDGFIALADQFPSVWKALAIYLA